ncbi:MAG: hypothetical protein IPO53_08110 [Chitinophagaceae bacterium]|nr:hypothetical protein [Chitinophagaceae bacterium]
MNSDFLPAISADLTRISTTGFFSISFSGYTEAVIGKGFTNFFSGAGLFATTAFVLSEFVEAISGFLVSAAGFVEVALLFNWTTSFVSFWVCCGLMSLLFTTIGSRLAVVLATGSVLIGLVSATGDADVAELFFVAKVTDSCFFSFCS